MRRILVIIGVLGIISSALLSGFYIFVKTNFIANGPLLDSKIILISKGKSVSGIGHQLQREGIISNRELFILGFRLFGENKPLRAGEFAFEPGMSNAEVISHIQFGKTVVHKVTFAEGLSSSEIVRILAETPNLIGSIRRLPAEGSLLPETYHFSFGDSRADIINRMQNAMKKFMKGAWSNRTAGLPLKNPKEALVLASIIEKETGVQEERSHVAAVFINRLRIGMPLQSDPTVIFGVTMGQRSLGRAISKADLRRVTAYNTYLIKGLPPGPITNPGSASILAALHPKNSKDLYFVANGKGGHAFSSSFEEHKKNVVNWRKVRIKKRNTIN